MYYLITSDQWVYDFILLANKKGGPSPPFALEQASYKSVGTSLFLNIIKLNITLPFSTLSPARAGFKAL